MAASRRQRLIEALANRLAQITVANGFTTDAGLNVAIGDTPGFGPDDPPEAIALLIGEDQVRYQGANLFVELPMEVMALARADRDEPWLAIEAVITDIKRAVELEDRTLGGLVPRQIDRGSTRAVPREEGSLVVGAVVTYSAIVIEQWGNP